MRTPWILAAMAWLSFCQPAAAAGSSAPAASAKTPAFQQRCGWLENPTPSNAWLTDRDGTWNLAVQGGHQAQGDWSPPFAPGQWVTTNAGSHGYGCACLSMQADASTHEVSAIKAARALPLATCRADRTLTQKPSEEYRRALGARLRGEGYDLSYPTGWRVHDAGVRGAGRCVQLNAPGRVKGEEYTLGICSVHAPLEKAAQDEAMFSPDAHGVWQRTAGMDAPSPVQTWDGAGWKGMLATQTCGVSDQETGFHAAGGECLWAVASDGKTSLVFDTVGFYQDFGQVRAIIDSVQFTPAAAR